MNPTIPDGYSTGPIQPAYSGSSSTYRLVTYAVSGSTVTVSDSDLHQTIYDVSASGSGTITGTADYATGTDVLTHAFGYDSNFDLTYETDARGNETDYLYDSYGQEVAEAKPSVLTSSNASPIRPTSYYSYGADYNLIAYCDPVYSNAHSMNWSTTPPTASDTLCPTTAGTLQAPGATVMQWTPRPLRNRTAS